MKYWIGTLLAGSLVLLAHDNSKAQTQLLDSATLERVEPYESLDTALKYADKTIKLVLRKSHLKEFPKDIAKLQKLQYLDLSKNKITEIPAWIDTLKDLRMLILSKNSLTSLPTEIGRLSNLIYLNVNQNELESIPVQISSLQNLLWLDLWSNNINSFPDELKYLKNLRVLDLRVILINDPEQKRLQKLLPNTTIYLSPSCNCGHN